MNKVSFSMSIDKSSPVPIYIQLYTYIKNQITINQFKAQVKLPSIREAASLLQISKTTVENSYNQLTVEGYIENQPKRGYFVCNISEYNYSSELLSLKEYNQETSNEFYFPNNSVDKNSFHIDTWKRLYNQVITDVTTDIYSNGSIQGEYLLRKAISDFVNSLRGGKTSPNQVIVGAGTQYLLGILTGLFKGTMATIAIETPGYKKAQYIFEDYLFPIVSIPVYESGVSIDLLNQTTAKLIYTSPSHQYPLGNVMPIKKRMELLNWASRVNGFIIEDDYDGLIRYDGMPIPCLQGLDKNDCVIYLGSFSKTILPSLRISFMIIPEKLTAQYQKIKNRYTQSTSKIDQLVLANFIKDGHMNRHLRKIRRIYKKKNSLILNYIQEYHKKTLQVINADSGFHLTCEGFSNHSIPKVLEKCKENAIFIEIIRQNSNKIVFSLNYSGIEDALIPSFIDSLAACFISP